MQCADRDLRGAVEAKGNADGADTAIHVQLRATDAVKTVREESAEGRQGEGAYAGDADLAAVGVAGEDEIDVVAARVGGDCGGIVGLVRHQQDRRIGVWGNRQIQVRLAKGDVVHTGEKDVSAAVVDADVLVDEQRQAIGLHVVANDARADDGIVVAEDAEANRAGEGAEDFGAAGSGGEGDINRHGATTGEVAGDEQEVGLERVDLVNDAAEKEILGVLLEVDVGDLDEAESAERRGQVGQEKGALNNLEFMPGPLVRVEGDCGNGGKGTGNKGAPGEQGRRSRLVELDNRRHRSS